MQQSFRCYTCGTPNPAGRYYCMRCGQSLGQWTMTQQVAVATNKQAKYQHFPCSRCGAPNVLGAPTCYNCYEHLYYTCPHCNAWVNNNFITCPNCYKPLNWPAQERPWDPYAGNTTYIPGQQYGNTGKTNKRSALPAILTVLLVGGLLIIGLDLLTSNSNPSSASSQPSVSTASVSNTPQTHSTSTSTQTPVAAVTLSPAPNTTPTPAPAVTSATVTNLVSLYEYSLPASIVNSASNTNSKPAYTPSADAYLEQLVPGWGHCSGGSCRRTCGY